MLTGQMIIGQITMGLLRIQIQRITILHLKNNAADDNTVAGDRTDDAADGTMDQSTDRMMIPFPVSWETV